MRTSTRLLSSLAATLVLSALASNAHANPRPLPFTYTYETLPEGEGEVEQYVDYTPVKINSQTASRPVYYGATQFQTEFEYGLLDRLELGVYVTFVPPASDSLTSIVLTEGNGVKERLRLRLAEAGDWPLDVALYGEVVENEREIELEGKIILQRRIGKLRAVTNLWAEREFYYIDQRDWVLNPTLGFTYEVTPAFQPGVEAWMRAEFPDPAVHPRPFNSGPHVYVGPTAMVNFGKLWWSTGVYLRTTDFGHSLDPNTGDAFGAVWIRTVLGVGF